MMKDAQGLCHFCLLALTIILLLTEDSARSSSAFVTGACCVTETNPLFFCVVKLWCNRLLTDDFFCVWQDFCFFCLYLFLALNELYAKFSLVRLQENKFCISTE